MRNGTRNPNLREKRLPRAKAHCNQAYTNYSLFGKPHACDRKIRNQAEEPCCQAVKACNSLYLFLVAVDKELAKLAHLPC